MFYITHYACIKSADQATNDIGWLLYVAHFILIIFTICSSLNMVE